MTKPTRLLTVLVLSLWVTPTMAQTEVHPYPDPGHRWLGVYAGGPEQHFDYFLRKFSLVDTFPDKAAWWEGLRKERTAQEGAHRHDVFIIYCGEKEVHPDDAKRRIDAWLKTESGCLTNPELIPAICLWEENVGSHNPLLETLAGHIREKYGIPVFQWFSDPLSPDPNLTADGWIWDSYGRDSVSFRKHLMKFTVLRKPAICVPWAADPHWPQWTQYPTAAALIDREWRQLDICREFNVGYFWVGLKGGTGTSTRLVQRIFSPRPLKELTVIADCNADAPNLGGSVTLSIAPRQGQPRWSVTSQGRHDGQLSLKVPAEELKELKEFDLHVTLSSSSGVEQGDKACAVLRRIQVQAK